MTCIVGGVSFVTSGWYENEINKRIILHEKTKGLSTINRYSELSIIESSDCYLSILTSAQTNLALDNTIKELRERLFEMKDEYGFLVNIACPSCLNKLESLDSSNMSINIMKELINGVNQLARYNDIYIEELEVLGDEWFPKIIVTDKDGEKILEMEKHLLPYLKLLEKTQKQFIDITQMFLSKLRNKTK